MHLLVGPTPLGQVAALYNLEPLERQIVLALKLRVAQLKLDHHLERLEQTMRELEQARVVVQVLVPPTGVFTGGERN